MSTTTATYFRESTTSIKDGTLTAVAMDGQSFVPLNDGSGDTYYTLGANGAPTAVSIDTTVPTLSAVSIASNAATTTFAKVGSVITLTVTGSQALTVPTMTIEGIAVTNENASTDGTVWTGSITVPSDATEGAVTFTVDFADIAGNDGTQVTAVTNGSSVTIDKTAPTLSSAVRGSDTEITVTLSELALASTITKATAGGFVVHETGTPATTYAVSSIAPGATNDLVVLTVASVAASNSVGLTVKYTAGGAGTVSDRAGNALATNATGVTIASWA